MRGFDSLNPITALIYYLFAICIPMFTLDPVIALISISTSALFDVLLQKRIGGKYIFVFLLFLISSLINPIFNQNGVTVLLFINDTPITLEALVYGIFSSLTLVSVIVWFFTFSSVMTSEKIIYIFGRISPKTALVISMALRFVPLFLKNYKKTENALKCTGLYDTDSLFGTLKLKIRAFSALLTQSTEYGIITADSMEMRGYGKGKRTFFSLYKFGITDTVFSLGVIFFGILCLCTLNGVQFYPTLFEKELLYSNVISYISYFILAVTPSILTVSEGIRWKYLLSKI